jgi:hypothetical protein
MAVEKDNDVAKNQLASLYFSNKNKKEVAFKIIGGIKEAESDSVFLASKIVILLWNEKIKEAQKVLEVLLNKFLKDDTAAPAISNSLSYFLVFKQKHFLYKLFSENVQSLKDRFKPVYFALLNEMKTELPNEYLKMPEELEEPVKDLLNFIQSERERLEIL